MQRRKEDNRIRSRKNGLDRIRMFLIRAFSTPVPMFDRCCCCPCSCLCLSLQSMEPDLRE
jgi:hypothetical protein